MMSDTMALVGGGVLAGAALDLVDAGAVILAGARVAAVGTEAELASRIARLPPEAVRRVDGALVVPGLVDAHTHLDALGAVLDEPSLVGAASLDETLARVRQRAATLAPGEWLRAFGWDHTAWPEARVPTADDVERAAPGRPVVLERIDGHAWVASRTALARAAISSETPDPPGGRIARDRDGRATGLLVDTAMNLVEKTLPPVPRECRKARLARACAEAARVGLVEVHDAGLPAEDLALLDELDAEGRLPIRVYVMLADEEALLADWFARGPRLGDRVTVRAVKLYADGALGSRGAALDDDYSDDPGNRGLMLATPAHLVDVARRARAAGFQVCTHAIGDRAIRVVLDAYQAAGLVESDRARVEHFQIAHPRDIDRLARMGVIASMQPTHATSDLRWAEQRLGKARLVGAYAWKSVLRAGGRLALGSDFPIEPPDPALGLRAAVERGGWYPDERLTPHEALAGFTSGAAYAGFAETDRGVIAPGMRADLTILDGDLATLALRARMTVVGGRVVFSRA